uniref:Uncharacterized protein n=1 Tax=Panagrolaimus superbus TaxID=310955 RepID=A0A914ZBA6_9BILA
MLGGRRNKMLKSYPPMPRPKHHRRRQQQNLSMDISDEKENHARLRTKRKRLPKGNYTFNGKVNCQKHHYGTTIGTVKLMEHDYFSDDDVIAVSKIQANGEFIVGGYADDGKMFSSVHLYLLFENVCVQGDSSEVWDAKPNHYYTFSIN